MSPYQHSKECNEGGSRHDCVVEDPVFVKVVLRGKGLPVLRSNPVDVLSKVNQAACRPEGGVGGVGCVGGGVWVGAEEGGVMGGSKLYAAYFPYRGSKTS
jgi:hypothetical protein